MNGCSNVCSLDNNFICELKLRGFRQSESLIAVGCPELTACGSDISAFAETDWCDIALFRRQFAETVRSDSSSGQRNSESSSSLNGIIFSLLGKRLISLQIRWASSIPSFTSRIRTYSSVTGFPDATCPLPRGVEHIIDWVFRIDWHELCADFIGCSIQ